MVYEFLKKQQEELIAKKIELDEDYELVLSKIKENEKFCYVYQESTQPQYSYSQQAIDFIYDELRKAPNTLLDDLKERCAKK